MQKSWNGAIVNWWNGKWWNGGWENDKIKIWCTFINIRNKEKDSPHQQLFTIKGNKKLEQPMLFSLKTLQKLACSADFVPNFSTRGYIYTLDFTSDYVMTNSPFFWFIPPSTTFHLGFEAHFSEWLLTWLTYSHQSEL